MWDSVKASYINMFMDMDTSEPGLPETTTFVPSCLRNGYEKQVKKTFESNIFKYLENIFQIFDQIFGQIFENILNI